MSPTIKLTRYLIIFATLLLISCNNDNPPAPKPADGRTVLVYMAANNSLGAASAWFPIAPSVLDIKEMEMAWNDNLGGKLFVFYNALGNECHLYEISASKDAKKITSKIVKQYPKTTNVNNTDFMRSVLEDVKHIAPAKSYGLFMWSHGSGWLPQGARNPLQAPVTQSPSYITSKLGGATSNPTNSVAQYTFGDGYYGGSSRMEMYDLAKSLDGAGLEYIYFDACHMASIEALYELQNVTKYIISSTAETYILGAPYHLIVEHMFGGRGNIIEMARSFYDYYNSRSDASRLATISVVETSKLKDLATAVKGIVSPNPVVPFNAIQQYGRSVMNYNNVFYDTKDFLNKTFGESVAVQRALDNAVIYKAATPKIFELTINTHCGLSMYIPVASQTKTLSIYRSKYQWATDSGLGAMVN